MRLIDADALQGIFNEVSTSLLCKKELEKEVEHMVRAFLMTTEMIRDAPTIDAVPVVRCKNCVHYRDTSDWDGRTYRACHLRADVIILKRTDNDFCSYGEREEATNDR